MPRGHADLDELRRQKDLEQRDTSAPSATAGSANQGTAQPHLRIRMGIPLFAYIPAENAAAPPESGPLPAHIAAGRGRGRGATLPSWMTAGEASGGGGAKSMDGPGACGTLLLSFAAPFTANSGTKAKVKRAFVRKGTKLG